MPYPVDRYTWQQSILSMDGPPGGQVRLVLVAISLHMNSHGIGAWPSQQTIADRASIGLRSVKRHLEVADSLGWIERRRAKLAGQKWRRTEYGAMVPDFVYVKLPERPWEKDPTWRRGATVAPSKSSVASQVPTVTEGGANHAEGGANGDRKVVPSFGLLTLPLNSSGNYPKEGASGTALGETREDRKAEIARLKAISKTPARPSVHDAAWLRKNLDLGMDVERIAKITASSPQEVRRAIADLDRHPDPQPRSTDPALQS